MSSQNFITAVTSIPADWANDVDDLVYDVFGAAKTATTARTALGLASMSLQPKENVQILGGSLDNVTIGVSTPGEGTFSRLVLTTVGPTLFDVVNRGAAVDIADMQSLLLVNTLLPGKGDLMARSSTGVERLPVGANSRVLIANTASNFGMTWGTFTQLAEKNPQDDPLQRGQPGDILVRTGTEFTRLPIGAEGQALFVDALSPQKVKWAPIAAQVSQGLTLERDVPVIGTDVGAVPNGFTFLEGLTFTEFVELVSTKIIPPVYNGPGLNLNGSPAPGAYEMGEILNITFTESLNIGNAGPVNARSLKKNGNPLSSVMPHTDPGVQMTGTPVTYVHQVSYDEGPCLINNMGQVDCSGRIPAGSATSNTLSYVGQRKAFYGTPASTPSSSAAVRALSSAFAASENGGVSASGVPNGSPTPNFIITIPVGATRVVFAYPATLRNVASVKYIELSDSEVKGNFVMSLVTVEGANGYAPVQYKVWTYVPVEPFSIENHYKVFI